MFHVSNVSMISKEFTSEAKDHILKGHIFKETYLKNPHNLHMQSTQCL